MKRSRAIGLGVAVGLLLGLTPAGLSAQYFGRNKVQYQTFDFHVLHTDHFDVYFYPEKREVAEDAARMAERWYARLSRVFNHEFTRTKPIIFYANHPDFQQTNTTEGLLSEGTQAFAESLKNRVVMPFTGNYADTDHILGHELVHAFQYDIAQRSGAMNQQGLGSLPLWLIEGMAEYLSVGRDDPHTAMWLRDAALRGDLPTFRQLTMDPRYFPYRYGQGLWAYIGGRWGDRAVTDLYKSALRQGWGPSVRRILRVTDEQLSQDWMTSIRSTYLPLMGGKERPDDIATRVVAQEIDGGRMNVGPALSPDGRYVAYFSERDLFETSLFLADARTGQVVRKLADTQTNAHVDALSFLSSAGAWSPDGSRLAFTVFSKGNEELAILRVADQRIERQVRIRGVGAVSTPAWSPDGRTIAVSGNNGGVTDLFLVDVETGAAEQLTDDRYADMQPAWSPDGRTLAFVTDREGTSFETLEYGPERIGLIDVATRRMRMLDLFSAGKHINPQFSPDGRHLYFISDADGFTDAYRVALETGSIDRITRLATGVSGVSRLSPALSVAAGTGDVMFSVFSEGNYAIYRMDAEQVEARAEPVAERVGLDRTAGLLPPVEAGDRGIVANYLDDPLRGLPTTSGFSVEAYSPSLALDYVGVPTVGVAVDRFGTGVAGSVQGYFSDMLGNRWLGVQVAANGGIKDVGGLINYQNRERQVNWGVVGGHIPYQIGQIFFFRGRGEVPVDTLELQILRIFHNVAMGTVEYPLSRTRRWEAQAGYVRYGFDLEAMRIFYNQFGQEVGHERVGLDAPPGLDRSVHMGTASLAYVGDWSNFGFTSPVRGGRFRLEASPTIGDLNVLTVTTDFRRYLYSYPFTLASRALHFGRYGPDSEESIFMRDLFLGYQTLVRGYSFQSFSRSECVDEAGQPDQTCPSFARLFGSRIAVANLEARVPLVGVDQFGLINFPFLPTELSAFVDAGVAWRANEAPIFEWDSAIGRTPVVSAGVSTRFNVLGMMVFEVYYAYPFQRPHKGAHFGFQLAPGW